MQTERSGQGKISMLIQTPGSVLNWCSHGFNVPDAQVTTVVNLLNFRLVLAISF